MGFVVDIKWHNPSCNPTLNCMHLLCPLMLLSAEATQEQLSIDIPYSTQHDKHTCTSCIRWPFETWPDSEVMEPSPMIQPTPWIRTGWLPMPNNVPVLYRGYIKSTERPVHLCSKQSHNRTAPNFACLVNEWMHGLSTSQWRVLHSYLYQHAN